MMIQNTEKDEPPSLSWLSDTNSEYQLQVKEDKAAASVRSSLTKPSPAAEIRSPRWSTQRRRPPPGANMTFMVKLQHERQRQWPCCCCCCVWRQQVYQQLRSVYPSTACRQFLDSLQQLEEECGYGKERIPQLRDVSAFLKGPQTLQLRLKKHVWKTDVC